MKEILPFEIETSGEFDEEKYNSFLEKGEMSHLFSENDVAAVLTPKTEFADELKNFVFGNVNAQEMGYATEKLYAFKKSDIEPSKNLPLDIASVSKIMRSISAMQGMQYYSYSRKVWGTLYNVAYRTENPDAKNPAAVPDLAEGDGDGQEIFAFLDDHSFGKTVYKIKYRQDKNQFAMLMENQWALAYGLVKAVKPGNFKMCVSVMDCGEYFLVYMGNYTEFKIVSALKKRLNNSFGARLDAIYNWFKMQF